MHQYKPKRSMATANCYWSLVLMQAAVHAAWRAHKVQAKKQANTAKLASLHRIPRWLSDGLQLQVHLSDEDFNRWYERKKDQLRGKSADQISMAYLRQVEAELKHFRQVRNNTPLADCPAHVNELLFFGRRGR